MLSLILSISLLPPFAHAADPASAARAASWSVEMSRGMASGFLVQLGSGYKLFTAHHVAGAKHNCGPGGLQKRKGFLGSQSRLFPFVASPENCNFPYNTASVPTAPGAALSIVSASELPQAGERVVITGYPMQRDSKQTQHTCTFRGFDQMNDHGEGDTGLAAYSLECDGVNYDIGGMSGGSAVSLRTGKVIGVLTGQQEIEREGENSYVRFVVASPLYLEGNVVRNGYPLHLPKARCYDSDHLNYSECEIKGGKLE